MNNQKECRLKNCLWCQKKEHWDYYRKPKKICAWCEKKEINYTPEQYLLKGNICTNCITMINEKFIEKFIEMIENVKLAKLKSIEKMEVLADILEEDISEEQRIKVVKEMKEEYKKINLEYDDETKNPNDEVSNLQDETTALFSLQNRD